MESKIVRAVCVSFVALLMPVLLLGGWAHAHAQDLIDPVVIEGIDTALSEMSNAGGFAGVVLVGQGDEPLLEKGYGNAVEEWQVPNTPDSVFRLNSLTMQFTGMAILSLYEQGVLDLDDPICDYLTRCPESWADITVYMLLTHSGGLTDFSLTNRRPEVLIDEPGAAWHGSPFGYSLLPEILNKVSEVKFKKYVEDTILTPLELEHTRVAFNPMSVLPNLAQPYFSPNLVGSHEPESDVMGASSMYSTAGDLFKWQRALFAGEVVSQESLELMGERAFPQDEGIAYGFGLRYEEHDGVQSIVHGGFGSGYSARMEYFPETDVTIIVLSNREHSDKFEEAWSAVRSPILAIDE